MKKQRMIGCNSVSGYTVARLFLGASIILPCGVMLFSQEVIFTGYVELHCRITC